MKKITFIAMLLGLYVSNDLFCVGTITLKSWSKALGLLYIEEPLCTEQLIINEQSKKVLQLIVIIWSNNIAALQLQLKSNINLNIQMTVDYTDDQGQTKHFIKVTPLDLAVGCNNAQMVEMLIHHGALVSFPSLRYRTSNIIRAIEQDNMEILELLLKNRASGQDIFSMIKKTLSTGKEKGIAYTPLLFAIETNNRKAVDILLNCGATLIIGDLEHWGTWFDQANTSQNVLVLALLVEVANRINFKWQIHPYFLFKALESGNIDLLKIYLEISKRVHCSIEPIQYFTIQEEEFLDRAIHELNKQRQAVGQELLSLPFVFLRKMHRQKEFWDILGTKAETLTDRDIDKAEKLILSGADVNRTSTENLESHTPLMDVFLSLYHKQRLPNIDVSKENQLAKVLILHGGKILEMEDPEYNDVCKNYLQKFRAEIEAKKQEEEKIVLSIAAFLHECKKKRKTEIAIMMKAMMHEEPWQ